MAIPKLALRAWHGGKKRKSVIHYVEDEHKQLPHVVKFSGGRSSGLMLLTLIKNNLLSTRRGDVVLFTNTAAEHPATYDFVAKMKRYSEQAGIPFFLAEFQTIETVVNGIWRRQPTYRLVNSKPFDSKSNPEGYHYRGEVFEESVTWSAMLPSVFTRVCTTMMKMLVTRLFLADYLGGCKEIPHLGHFSAYSKVDIDTVFREHKRNGGKMERDEFEKRWQILAKYPCQRPSQTFSDYSKPSTVYTDLVGKPSGPIGYRLPLKGDYPAKFLTFLGFRDGENPRYQRMIDRNNGLDTRGHDDHPPGEYSYAPLYDLGIDKDDVLAFWRKQPRSIKPYLPEHINLSNCVYCFLKGPRNIVNIAANKQEFENSLPKKLREQCNKKNTPNKIQWWDRLEKKHSRTARKIDVRGTGNARFGMFGLNNFEYGDVKAVAAKKRDCPSNSALDIGINCECTD